MTKNDGHFNKILLTCYRCIYDPSFRLFKFAHFKRDLPVIRNILICFLLCCFLCPSWLHAQDNATPSRAELEKKKLELQKELEQANDELSNVQQNRKLTVRQAQLLQNKLAIRNKLIKNTNQEINFINGDINRANRDVRTLQNDLDTLKAQYAKLVLYAYKNRSAYNYLNFILSANSFNEAVKRFQYIKQYRAYRKHQAASIIQTEALLKQKIAYLSDQKEQRTGALTTEKKQRELLEQERKEKDEVVQSLRGREKELMADINAKKRAQRKLNATISILIKKEIEEARRKAAAEAAARAKAAAAAAAEAAKNNNNNNSRPIAKSEPAAPPPAAVEKPAAAESRPANVLEATPEEKLISENFEGNRGKLPWPVERGFISDPFGVHKHAVLQFVEQQNDGVNIDTDKGATARAVFNGEVVTATFDPFNKWTVLIRHGQYFTVYSNLMKALVKEGDQVSTKKPIGIIYTNDQTDESYIHFLIYKGSQPVNPALWLSSSH
jgi:septal ring factor EnvC (AmiA/AmiB activator)